MYLPGHFEQEPAPAAGPSYSMRRPWSPVDYGDDIAGSRGINQYFSHGRNARAQRRSDDSIEALDLADYARTLRRPTADRNSPYPPFPHTSHVHPLSVPTPVHLGVNSVYPEYPPSPDVDRPFSSMSRDTLAHPTPSLVSGPTSYDSHESYRGRPYSLPPVLSDVPQGRGPAIFSPSASADTLPRRIISPVLEEDISRFPAFSHGWYDDPFKTPQKLRHTSLPPFFSEQTYNPRGSYHPVPPSASSQARSTLPWGSQLSDKDGPPVDRSVMEDRLIRLENEFGPNGEAVTGGGQPMIGSVDENGTLITAGPKRRLAARWAQGILAVGAAFSSFYGALFVKPPAPAPPASKAPAFTLYGLSVLTLGLMFYLFVVQPCCCKRPKPEESNGLTADGMMVLPVQGLPGGKKKDKGKKGKEGKRGGGDGGGGDVQVNLIMDPEMFGRGQDDGSEDEYGSRVSAPRRPKRRGIFRGLQMEREWIEARSVVRRMVFIDIACLIAWAGVFVFILFGKKCPPGTFGGWCDSYNIASAAACLLSLAYGFSAYFGIIDLYMSKMSPRTRT